MVTVPVAEQELEPGLLIPRPGISNPHSSIPAGTLIPAQGATALTQRPLWPWEVTPFTAMPDHQMTFLQDLVPHNFLLGPCS